MYPTSPAVVTPAGVREAFEPWGVAAHTVASVNPTPANYVEVETMTGGTLEWTRTPGGAGDQYHEYNAVAASYIFDHSAIGDTDKVSTDPASPSQPTSDLYLEGPGKGDDSFLDVIFYTH